MRDPKFLIVVKLANGSKSYLTSFKETTENVKNSDSVRWGPHAEAMVFATKDAASKIFKSFEGMNNVALEEIF